MPWKPRKLLVPGYMLLGLIALGSADRWAESGLELVIGLTIFLAGMFPVGFLSKKLEKADYQRRLRPVREALETHWQRKGSEKDYQRELVQHLFHQLSQIPKPESPLPSGTRVDAYLEHGNEDWYITIKRGLKKNQQRLILQGEIEDIILHAPRKDRDLWIYVIVGLHYKDPNELAQLKHLAEYAVHRSLVNGRSNKPQNDGPRVNIELMAAAIVPDDFEGKDEPPLVTEDAAPPVREHAER